MLVRADDAKDWFYKGEGAANIVLGYCGSALFLVLFKRIIRVIITISWNYVYGLLYLEMGVSVEQVGKVLRIQKVAKGGSPSPNGCLYLSDHERLIWKDIGELAEPTSKDVAATAFIDHVMRNLLGSKHIDAGVCYFLCRDIFFSFG